MIAQLAQVISLCGYASERQRRLRRFPKLFRTTAFHQAHGEPTVGFSLVRALWPSDNSLWSSRRHYQCVQSSNPQGAGPYRLGNWQNYLATYRTLRFPDRHIQHGSYGSGYSNAPACDGRHLAQATSCRRCCGHAAALYPVHLLPWAHNTTAPRDSHAQKPTNSAQMTADTISEAQP